MPHGIKKTIVLSLFAVILMFGFSFALVPLYRVVCKVTGLNGGVNVAEINTTFAANAKRQITIQFLTTNNENLPWEFYPKKNTLKVYSEEKAEMLFYAKNNSTHTMTVQAIPSFAPQISAKYFHKIECFCFRQQTLKAGEAKWMPVIFRVDQALPREIQVITLAYTLFDINKARKSA
jgi:cytochrome c oxidase assembly protein subunit 11